MEFSKSVFINCPFDTKYQPMLRSMLFTVISLGYFPRLAIECTDASINRLEKIASIIKESRISIHDLSRIKSEGKGEFARMNMPFEYGLDFGCKRYSEIPLMSTKKFLVLGSQKYEYMRALSDISGIDIVYHNDDETRLVKEVRHWFVLNESIKNAPSPNDIWMRFMDFNYKFLEKLQAKGYSMEDKYEIPLNEVIDSMEEFVVSNPNLS